MKKSFFIAAVAAALSFAAFAESPARIIKPLPDAANGTNAVVAVQFAKGNAVAPVAFDIYGGTASSGTVEAYIVRQFNGTAVTNTLKAAASCAATNVFSSVSVQNHVYSGEKLVFKFSAANGGTLVVYGDRK